MEENETGPPQVVPPPREPAGGAPHPSSRIEAALDWLEGAGLGIGWLERVVYWWKHFGVLKALGVVLAVALPVIKYAGIPSVASRTVSTIAEGYGAEIEVDDWSGDLLDLRASASDVVVRARGNYAQDEIFTARKVTLDLSLWRRITKGQWIDAVEFDTPSLYAERLLSGRWNWQDFAAPSAFEREPPPAMLAGVGEYRAQTELPSRNQAWRLNIPLIRMNGLRIQWVENLPSESGGGLIQTSRATIYIDDVRLVMKNFYRPADYGEGPLDFSIEGRTGDGRISFNGFLNPYNTGSGGVPEILPANRRREPRGAPTLATSIYLDNVGVAALSAVAYESSLVPSTGTVTGRIELVVDRGNVDCLADVTLRNVKWQPQQRSRAVPAAFPALVRQLEGLRADGRVRTTCDGTLEEGNYRAIPAIQAAVTSKALEDAPPVVRALARVDEKRFTGAAQPMTAETVKAELAQQIRTAGIAAIRQEIGDEGAAFFDRTLPKDLRPPEGAGNPITKGWKRLKNGLRRLTS